MTHLGDADENANSSSSTHLRLRTPINFKKEHEPDYCENHAETGNSTQSSTKTSEDESTTEDVKSNAAIFQHIAVAKVRHQAQELKKQLIFQMDHQLTTLMEEFIAEVELVKVPQKYTSFIGGGYPETTSRKKKTPCGSLAEKEFVTRNSLLTDLFEVSHIQTIYHIFIAILILLFMNTMIEDVIDKGQINFDFELIQWAFGNLQTVFFTWLAMKVSALILYPLYHLWSHHRLTIVNRSKRRLWDYLWLAAYIVYIGAVIYLPVKETVVHKLPPASAVTLLLEQVRILMKTHAFVRSNVPISIAFCNRRESKEHLSETGTTAEDSPCPHFSKYLYFLFAPTLVYRNNYPRTHSIRWKWVCWNFLQVVGVLFYLYFIFVRFCVPVFRQIGHEPMSGKAFALAVFGCMLPGTLVLLCGFFCLLHSWLNAFAEMLRFGDRMFYQDWWNSSTYASYYRTWNVVVHDWLYTYVYKDVYELCGRRSRVIPMMVVFFISSLFHEYIITFTFRCFYPILLLMFGGFGLVFAFFTNVERRLGNIFMWLTLFIGTGLFMSLYSMEWYARINCPASVDGILDIFIPRSWACLTVGGN